MADPFFDEDDDGDFDDLYGHPAVKRTEPASTNASISGPYPPPTSSAQPLPTRNSMEDHGVYSYPVSPASSVPSTTYSRSDAGGRARLSSATAPGRNSMSKPRNRREQSDGVAVGGRNARKARRKGSEELFDVDWEDDSQVKSCVVCSSGFSLMKRKHHCRHCGRVMCSDCSTFRYFEVSHKKHRVCSSCNSDLVQRNRLGGREIDDEASYNRSVVTDDELDEDGSFNATPSSSSGKKRGKFRASLKKTFTPKHTKKSGDERRRANEDINNVAASCESNVREGVQIPVHRPLEERKQSSDLFDVADDTWFTDPHEGEVRNAASKKQNLFDFDDDDSNFDSRKRNENQRYSLAQPKLGTAADEWNAELSRHTIAGSRGSMPKTTRQDSLSIDAYASRSDDEYDTGRPLRMEMPRPNEWQAEPGRHTITGTRGGMPKAMRQDSLSIDAYALRSDDEYDTGRPLRMEMPRPNRQHVIVKADTYHEEKMPVVVQHAAAHDERGSEEDQSPGRLTLKENLKGMFHIHGKKDGHKKKDKKKDKRNSEPQIKSSSAQPQSTSDRNSAAEKPYAPPQPVVNSQARPTFYDANADDLVVDDTPGYFDRTNSQAYRSLPVEPQQRDTDYSRWASAPLPKSVEPRAILSDADSYSIVETPTPNDSPATTQDSTETKMPVASSSPQEKSGSGLTGVFKRFFGISASKSTDKHTESSQKAPPVVPPTEVEAASSSTSAIVAEDNNSQMVMYDPQSSSRESNALQRETSFNRFSMVERSYLGSDANHQLDVSRYTIAEYSNPTTDFPPRSDTVITATTTRRVSMFSSSTSTRDVSQKKRRDTFDDLFESSDSHGKNAAVSDEGRHTLPTRAWDSVATSSTSMMPTTGVSRFDRRRDSDVPQNVPTLRLTERPMLDRGRTSSIGLGESRFVNEQTNHGSNRPAGNAWSAVRAEPTFGVATYAVPSSISSDRFARGSDPRYDERGVSQPTASHSIMEDLHHQPSSAIRPSRETNSLDDFLAEFERPNDYVFDSVTGGYVSASAPKRAKEPVAYRSETNYTSMPAQEQRSPVMHIHELQNSRYEQLERYEQPARYDQPQRRKQETVQSEAGGDEDDELDETIVDKISSLEGELAALKQLIRKRKDHEHSSSGSRNSHVAIRSTAVARSSTTVQGPRKMSIFDTNSSDEEEIVRKKPAKKKTAKKSAKRRDSFADLFEDSPVESSNLAGGKGYEALFQAGSDPAQGSSDEEDAKEEGRRGAKSKSAVSIAITAKEPTKTAKYDELSDEEDFPSLKNRSKTRTASQRKKNAVTTVAAASSSDSEEEKRSKKSLSIATVIPKSVTTKEAKQPKKKKTLKPATVDSIDALFDVSDERDVTNFFEQDESKTSKANHLSDAAGESESDDDKVSQKQADLKQRGVAKQEEVVVENVTVSDEDSDEEFALSLANAKSGRSQRGSLKSTPATPSQSVTQEADIKETNSDADSDEEFALSLKNRRAAASPAKRGSQQTDQVASSSQGLLQNTTQSNDKLVDSDEEFALSLKKPKHRRVKSVSFLLDAPEQQHISNETTQPHLDVVTEVVNSVESVSVDSVSLTTRNSSLFDVFDSAPVTVAIELKVAPDADAVSSEAAPSVTNVDMPASATQEQESSKLSSSVTSESAPIPLGMDSVDADRESTRSDRSEELIFEVTNHILRETRAEVLSIETSRHSSEALTQNTRENSTPTREKHRHSVGDDSFGLFDQSNDPYSMALGSTSLTGDESEEDDDLDDDVNDDQSEMFSFEVQSKKRVSQSVTPSIETIGSRNKSMSDPEESLFLGKYAPSSNQISSTAIGEQLQHEASVNANDAAATLESPEPLLLDQQLPALGESHPEVDADWQQMQEQEKERRKKLQLKQRQAQRDKLLKKQGSRHQLLTSTSSSNNLNAEKAEKKKKKKSKSKDVSEASGSSSRKKSSSRKHKHKHGSTDNDDERKEAPSTLTEL